jgi:hypothetical protein
MQKNVTEMPKRPKWYITKDFQLIPSTGRRPNNTLTKIEIKHAEFVTKLDAKIVRDAMIRKPRKKK